jgi:hypothetical protein
MGEMQVPRQAMMLPEMMITKKFDNDQRLSSRRPSPGQDGSLASANADAKSLSDRVVLSRARSATGKSLIIIEVWRGQWARCRSPGRR